MSKAVPTLMMTTLLVLGSLASSIAAGTLSNGDFASLDDWSGAIRDSLTDDQSLVDPSTDAHFALQGGGYARLSNDDNYYEVVLFQDFDLDAATRTLSFDYVWSLTADDSFPPDFVQATLWLADFSDYIDLFPHSIDTSAASGSGTTTTDISAFAGQAVSLEFLLQDGDFDEQDWLEIGQIEVRSAVPLPPTAVLLLLGLGILARRVPGALHDGISSNTSPS